MSDAIVRLKVESQEYDQKLKRATEGLTRYADECRKVGGTLEVVEKETLDYVRALGKMDTVAKTTNGSLSEMKKAYTELSMQYRKMTDEEKKGEYGQALRQSLDQLRGRIKETEGDLKDINKELTGSSGLSGALDQVAGKFGLSIKQLTGWGAALGAGKMALDVAKDAFFQSESNIDEWGRTLKGAEGAYQVFLDTLNNGNWSNFFQNLETAIRGGRDLYDVFDRLGSIKSNNAAAIALVQQQIAALRLAKQQGKNVDDQLKAATARLAQLQGQAVSAGKDAGNKAAFNVIRNGVNSIGGARVNDATINLAVSQLMTGGQAQFDKFRNNYQILQRKGTRTVVQQLDDGMGGTVNKYRETFDINALTREEQKQYAIAKAITEGETRIQAGISAFAQAVSEGTASAREEFRGNRYSLQGRGGGGGGGKGGVKTSTAQTSPQYAADSIAAQQALVSALSKQWSEAGADVRNDYLAQLIAAEEVLKRMKDEATMFRENSAGRLLERGPIQTSQSELGTVTGSYKNYQVPGLSKDVLEEFNHPQKDDKGNKGDRKLADQITKLTSGISGITGGIKAMGFDLPNEVEQVISVVQGVMSVIEGVNAVISIFSNTAMTANTAALIANTTALYTAATTNLIPLARGGIVPHAAGGYMIPGNNMSGDNIFAGNAWVNSGELVLNKAQQGNLASQLSGSGLQNLHLSASVHGEQIVLAVNNTMKRKNKGELATFR